MSQEFDILYNQVNSNQASSLDEYEKSVFLTKAQDEIVKAYFDPRGNKFIEGFDGSEKRQYDFSMLVKNEDLSVAYGVEKYDPRSLVYALPERMLMILNESIISTASGSDTYIYQIIPISYTEYQRLMQKPYQYPAKRQAWRLITGDHYDDASGKTYTGSVCEIIGRFNTGTLEYRIRYVVRPYPIILENLNTSYNGLSIDGYKGDPSTETGIADGDGGISCKLPEGVHHEVVQRAVELATAVYNPQAVGTITGIGNVSSTNIGVVPRQESK